MAQARKTSVPRAIAWASGGRAVRAVLQVAFFITLGRALGPEGFAVLVIAMLAYQLVYTMVTQGLAEALVQEGGFRSATLATAFWLNIGLGVGLVGLAALFALPVADWLGMPDLAHMIPVFSGIGALSATNLIALSRLQVELNFRMISAAELSGTLLGVLAAFGALLLGLGAWSVAVLLLVQRMLEAFILQSAARGWPEEGVYQQEARGLIRLSVPLLGVHGLTFVNTASDQIILAASLSPVELGAYGMARRLIRQPAQIISVGVRRVLFPALVVQMGDDGTADPTSETNTRVLLLSAITQAPLLGGLVLGLYGGTAPHIIPLLMGADWNLAGELIGLMAVSAIFMPLYGTLIASLRAAGWNWAQFWFYMLRTCLTVGAVLIAVAQGAGALGVALTYSLVQLLMLPLNLELVRRARKLESCLVWIAFLRGTIPSALALAGSFTLSLYIPASNSTEHAQAVLLAGTGGLALWLLSALLLARSALKTHARKLSRKVKRRKT